MIDGNEFYEPILHRGKDPQEEDQDATLERWHSSKSASVNAVLKV
jgi:hypothetical protein